MTEQQQIADMLDKADDIRRKRREAIALTDDLLRSTFLDMFGDPVTNPKGWPVKELNEFVPVERPITYGILMPGPDVQDGVLYVRVVDIKDGAVHAGQMRRTSSTIDHQYRRSRLRVNDILLSIRGHVGRTALVTKELEGANITQDTARVSVEGISHHYVRAVIDTRSMQRWMTTHVRGVAVQGINIGDVRRMPIPSPPRCIQDRFTDLIERMHRSQLAQRYSLRATESLRSSLVNLAFTKSNEE